MVAIQHTQESAKNVRKESSIARIVGSGSAGVLELALFHPVRLTLPPLVGGYSLYRSIRLQND